MDLIHILLKLDNVCHETYQVVVKYYYLNRDCNNSMYLRNCAGQEVLRNMILSNSQCGFIRYRSTQTALVENTAKILSSLDAECSTIAIFIELKKAFDTIDVDILI